MCPGLYSSSQAAEKATVVVRIILLISRQLYFLTPGCPAAWHAARICRQELPVCWLDHQHNASCKLTSALSA